MVKDGSGRNRQDEGALHLCQLAINLLLELLPHSGDTYEHCRTDDLPRAEKQTEQCLAVQSLVG